MRIERLASTNFRNLNHEPLAFCPQVNLIEGDNGQGKTNLLEAISVFKVGRSFRTMRDTDMICFGREFMRVEVCAGYERGETERFELGVQRNGEKKLKIENEEIRRRADLVGRYACTLFGPQDLGLVSGVPAERRKFVDMVGCMTDRGYLDDIRGYRRALMQRNAALKAGDFASAFGVWTERLLKSGCAVARQRQGIIRKIAEEVREHAAALGVELKLELSYDSALVRNRPDAVPCETHFAAGLAAVEAEETRRRMTLVGPHRDDLALEAGGRDLRRFGSQGQRRLAAVLLRLAEMSRVEKAIGEKCVFLVDDLFSEFDARVAANLRERLGGGRQVFVTTPVPMKWAAEGETRTFRVRGGCVEG